MIDVCLRHAHRPGVGLLRLLEGHGDKRYVGSELYVAHRRQAIQRMLRKFSGITLSRHSHISYHIVHRASVRYHSPPVYAIFSLPPLRAFMREHARGRWSGGGL